MGKKVKFEMSKAFHVETVYELDGNKIIHTSIYKNAWVIFDKKDQPQPDTNGNYMNIDLGDNFEYYDPWSSDTTRDFKDKKLERKIDKLLDKANEAGEDWEGVLQEQGFEYDTEYNIVTQFSGTLKISDL